jgi:hypothetical protein
MKPAIAFPQYALAVWTLGAPLVVGVIEWFISRRQPSGLRYPVGRSVGRPATTTEGKLTV